MHLNTWSSVGGIVWGGYGAKEVASRWRKCITGIELRVYIALLFLVCALFAVYGCNVISGLPAPDTVLHLYARRTGHHLFGIVT